MRKISVLKSPQFCGTIFSVTRAVDISTPRFRPRSCCCLGVYLSDLLTIIQVKELDDEPPLLTGFTFA